MLSSYTLLTPQFTLFMWVTDANAVSLSSSIANGAITATCGSTAMSVSTNSYFTMTTSCTGTIQIVNTITYGVLYTGAAPSILIYSVQLSRFLYPTVRLQYTKLLTAETNLNVQLYLYNGTYNTSYGNATCKMNTTTQVNCNLSVEMTAGSTLYYNMWLVSNSMTIDTIVGQQSISATVPLQVISYDFKRYYFGLLNIASAYVNTSLTLTVGGTTAIQNAGTQFYYLDTFTITPSILITIAGNSNAIVYT